MILITLVALGTMALADPGPLAPARDGLVQCYEPNVEQKTCQSIASYRFETNGRILNKAETVLGDNPRIVLIAEAEVYVRDGAECSSESVSPDHILSVEVDGLALSGDDLAGISQVIATAINEEVGEGEFCSTYHHKPDGSMTALVTVSEQPRADLSAVVRWVRREDGWRLEP
jgi:hypothetical protein